VTATMRIRMSDPYPVCLTTDVTDDDARKLAAEKLGLLPEKVEVLRTGGGVMCREKREDGEADR